MPHTYAPNSRRLALKLTASTLAASALQACGGAQASDSGPPAQVQAAVAQFAAMAPGSAGVLVQNHAATGGWSVGHQAGSQLFVGSAVKTFILAQFLRNMESNPQAPSVAAQVAVDDAVRSPGSPVLIGLSGSTTYRTALEAMIAHSDNTATDMALAAAQPDRVRALIREAGLAQTLIPDSTRKLFSYLAGAPSGTDLGWAGMQALDAGPAPGLIARKNVINTEQSMLSSASDMVRWYHSSLAGRFFQKPETLTEYKRVQAMADAIWMTLPPEVPAFGKGGSLDWEGFHCLCFAGQMQLGAAPVGFCFILNWMGAEGSVERTPAFIAAVTEVLGHTVRSVSR